MHRRRRRPLCAPLIRQHLRSDIIIVFTVRSDDPARLDQRGTEPHTHARTHGVSMPGRSLAPQNQYSQRIVYLGRRAPTLLRCDALGSSFPNRFDPFAVCNGLLLHNISAAFPFGLLLPNATRTKNTHNTENVLTPARKQCADHPRGEDDAIECLSVARSLSLSLGSVMISSQRRATPVIDRMCVR